MVGKIIRAERLKQKIKSKDLAAAIGVDTGHLSHIENGVRNPSQSILYKICEQLNLSYQFMLNVSKNSVEDNTSIYDVTEHVPYKKILCAENFSLVDCPEEVDNISLVTKMKDNSMEPVIKKDAYLYVAYTNSLEDKDLCVISYNDAILVREFSALKNSYKFNAKNSSFEDLTIEKENSNLQIIGKVVFFK